jgi:lysophospholipase L1-like esterase
MLRPAVLAAAAALVLALALPASASARKTYYVSLGDSWAQGYQPLSSTMDDIPTNQGVTDFLFPRAKRLFPGLKLVKLGCGGATTGSMINGGKRCVEPLPYTSASPATSQLAYAAKFLRKHRSSVAFVTLTIGGNDFASCVSKPDIATVLACATAGVSTVKADLPVITRTLRKAAGRKAIIVASTYSNIGLGAWVQNDKPLAQASVSFFKQLVNPPLKSAYRKQRIGFVDTTAAFGGYIPLSRTTTLAPYGQIPVAVANICKLSWACVTRPQGIDIHLRPSGYSKLANLFLAEVKRELRG